MVSDSTSEFTDHTLPKWIQFMIWAGWVMRTNNTNSRQIMAMLLPERYCCSAFCSWGAVIAGSTLPCASITWDEFASFDDGMKIYLLVDHDKKIKPVEGVVGDFYNDNGLEGRWVSILSRNKKFKNSSVLVLSSNIEKFQLSTIPHASQIRLGKLKNISKFYDKYIPGYQETWITCNNIESAIVTNKASWIRQIEDIKVIPRSSSNGGPTNLFDLSTLLMISDCDDTPSSHTRVISSVSSEDVSGIPLIILDGVDALSKWDNYINGNTIILLSRAEFSEEAENILSMLSTYRDDSLLNNLDIDPTGIMPFDSEIALFALQGV